LKVRAKRPRTPKKITPWNRIMDRWERRNADGKGRNVEEM
jgi:hypothetical protein